MNTIGNLYQVMGTHRGFRLEPIPRYGMGENGMLPIKVNHGDIVEVKDNTLRVVK